MSNAARFGSRFGGHDPTVSLAAAPRTTGGTLAAAVDAAALPEAVAAALKSGDTESILLRYAHFLTGSAADADDLLAKAIATMCDRQNGRPWKPTQVRFMTHMRWVLHDLARQERQSARARRERVEDGQELEDLAVDVGPLPDEALDEARRRHRCGVLGERLRSRLTGDALTVFDAMCRGADSVPELTALLGSGTDGVYRVKKVIAYHAQCVLAEERRDLASRKSGPSARPRARQPEVP
jgi:hypothetical protein